MSPVVVWFRQDLRLADQPALAAAVESGRPVAPLYVLDDETPGKWRAGGASRWWLHGSLQSLSTDLAALGSPLTLRRGRATAVVGDYVSEIGAGAVYCTRHVEPFWRAADCELEAALPAHGVEFRRFAGGTLFEPGSIAGRDGRRLRVFSPFWRACLAAPPPETPLPAPSRLRPLAGTPLSEPLQSWRLLPTKPDWAQGLRETWRPGEAEAHQQLQALAGYLRRYHADRNRPEPAGTSRLSPRLHHGELSARQVWHTASARIEAEPALAEGGEAYLRELAWREFYAHMLVHHPDLPERPLQARFAGFPWSSDPAALAAWQRGRTGFPIVDAGMRQLWRIGWMHNRVRMIAASFLIKDLLIPWQTGQEWFWDTLVDADLASNAGSWQWVAGCGSDAAPYFRIFNPVTQGERFDPTGAYVRRWVPELARLPDRWIHRPWQAPPLELAEAGVQLGRTYPHPLLDHGEARERALAAFARVSAG